MIGDELLFKNNPISSPNRFKIKGNCIYYKNEQFDFNGRKIQQLIGFIDEINTKYKGNKIPILLDLGDIQFQDKLSYIILECICHYTMTHHNRKILIDCRIKSTIWTEGVKSSVLQLLTSRKVENFEKFKTNFNHEIYGRHYRRIIMKDEWGDKYLNSRVMEQIGWFLKNLSVDKENRDVMAEVISELVGNVNDHTEGDCLVDIDVTTEYVKESSNGTFYGLNLVVLNFSNRLFGEGIKEKLSNDDMLNERHRMVKTAYDNHTSFFDDSYREEDFYNITAFQHRISGRYGNISTGGTGLTKLIYSLEERSDTHNCYMISGERAVVFKQNLLQYNSNRWIGFNEHNDYFSERPSDGVVMDSYVYIPGTAYNLTFAMRKGEVL